MTVQQGTNIQSISRAMAILNYVAAHANSSLSEISEAVGLGRSTAHNMLKTLKAGGYIYQAENGAPYSIGFQIFNIARLAEHNNSLTDIAFPDMSALNRKYNESVNLCVILDGARTYNNTIKSTQDIRITSYVGKRNPIHTTAAGKMLLSAESDDEIDAFLEDTPLTAMTPLTITDPEKFKAVLKRIHDQGYALDEGEYIESIWCASAPIISGTGRTIAAISMSFPANRINSFNKDLVIQDVVDCAAAISEKLPSAAVEGK